MPLTGLRVIDLTRLLPGPFCTQLLGDLGADVVKVEDTAGGDGLRHMPPLHGDSAAVFHSVNRNKRSIAVDLKQAAGREVLLRLVDGADVFVESFRPGVLDRLGLGVAVLRERNPRLIVCSITGYGQDGPYRDRAGHDLNYAALSGALGLGAAPGGEPAMPGLQAGDLGGGALGAAIAILSALYHRDRTGEGQHCDVAMFDGLVSWLAPHAAAYFGGGAGGDAAALPLNGRHPCYTLYRCADGVMSVAALEAKFWETLLEVLGLPHLAGGAYAEGDEAAAVHAQIEAVFLTRSRAQWAARFAGRDVCCEPVLRIDEVFANEQVRHRGLRLDAGVGGPLPQTGFPFRLSVTPPSVRRPAPGYGEHTRELLGEAGYDARTIGELAASGVTR